MEADAPSKSSNVWKHFVLLKEKQKTKCNLCGTELSYRGGGTSTMKKHLEFKHPASLSVFSNSKREPAAKTTQKSLDGRLFKLK